MQADIEPHSKCGIRGWTPPLTFEVTALGKTHRKVAPVARRTEDAQALPRYGGTHLQCNYKELHERKLATRQEVKACGADTVGDLRALYSGAQRGCPKDMPKDLGEPTLNLI